MRRATVPSRLDLSELASSQSGGVGRPSIRT
jgi:hypothetical protein